MTEKCGGTTRSGGKCKNAAGFRTDHLGEGRCYLHGGATPRAAESPHFKHGMYSKYMSKSLREKADSMEVTIDLVSELMLMRALLADYVSRFDTYQMTGDDLDVVGKLAGEIRKITDSMVRQQTSTALTAVEIALLVEKIPLLVMKYVQGTEAQRAFVSELFDVIPSGREGFGETGLPSGVIAHPDRAK